MTQVIITTEPVFGKVLHIYGTPEAPLVAAADLAAWINHSNPTMMVNSIDADEKLTLKIPRLEPGADGFGTEQNRSVTMLTELGLNGVLYRKSTGKTFQKEIKRTLAKLRQNGNMVTTIKPDLAVTGPKIFNYNGTDITFQLGDGTVMVNATEMAKPFRKLPYEWLRLPSTIEFLKVLKETKGLSRSLVETVEGRGGGTWFHEDVALEFARWLAPAFGIWCNDRIKELLQHGMTALPGTLEEMISNPDLIIGLAQKVKETQAKLNTAQEKLALQQPKADFHDRVMGSPDLIPVTIIAKGLGMTGQALNKVLHDKGIIFSVGKTWVLYAKYQDKGYAYHKIYTTYGEEISRHLYWTEKGCEFIYNLFKA